jgi:hypothetical protein
MPRKSKPLSGQITLIGEVHEYRLKYQPVTTPEGIIVLRLPANIAEIDRKSSLEEMQKMANRTKPKPRFFRRKNSLLRG